MAGDYVVGGMQWENHAQLPITQLEDSLLVLGLCGFSLPLSLWVTAWIFSLLWAPWASQLHLYPLVIHELCPDQSSIKLAQEIHAFLGCEPSPKAWPEDDWSQEPHVWKLERKEANFQQALTKTVRKPQQSWLRHNPATSSCCSQATKSTLRGVNSTLALLTHASRSHISRVRVGDSLTPANNYVRGFCKFIISKGHISRYSIIIS